MPLYPIVNIPLAKPYYLPLSRFLPTQTTHEAIVVLKYLVIITMFFYPKLIKVFILFLIVIHLITSDIVKATELA